MATGIATDEEIAFCLARIVTEAAKKPYFEYRDFVPRRSGSMVPEGEEAPYFRAILKTIVEGQGASAVAFLIDEFEEVGLQRRFTKRAAHDYLATLKRLINLAQSEKVDFWVVLSMTFEAYRKTEELEPALLDRMGGQGHRLELEPLSQEDARELLESRIEHARTAHEQEIVQPAGGGPIGSLFPFPDSVVFRPDVYSNPRRLIKACFQAISRADGGVEVPFTDAYLRGIEGDLYPNLEAEE